MANEQSLKAENKVWKQETFTNEKEPLQFFMIYVRAVDYV